MVSRFFKRLGLAMLWIVTLGAIVLAIENWRGARAWTRYVSDARAKGHPIEAATLSPPPADDAENIGSLPLFEPLFDFTVDERTGKPIWGRPAERDHLLSQGPLRGGEPAVGADGSIDLGKAVKSMRARRGAPEDGRRPAGELMLEELAEFEPELAQLRAAIDRPRARFPQFARWDMAMMPELWMYFVKLSKISWMRGLAYVSRGDAERAKDECLFGLKLANVLREEPITISQVARTHLAVDSLRTVRQATAQHLWNDRQLAEVQQSLKRIDLLAAAEFYLRIERATGAGPMVDYVVATGRFDMTGRKGIDTGQIVAALPGWADFNRVAIAEYGDALLPTVNLAMRRVDLAQMKRIDGAARKQWWNPHRVLCAYHSAFGSRTLAETFVRVQTELDLADCALALERHRLAQGGYPERLDQLVPKELRRVPFSGATGEPFRYHRLDDGDYELWVPNWGDSYAPSAHAESPREFDLTWRRKSPPARH